jgi:hypothetical protein
MSISSLPYPSIQQQRTGGQSIPTPSDKLIIAQLNSLLTPAERLIKLLNQNKQNSSSITQTNSSSITQTIRTISMIKGLLENFEKQRDESSITIPYEISEKYAELQRQLKEFQSPPDQ